MKANRLVQLALLATIALTIFIVELRIPNPMPIPGVKLGLANIVTVYAIYHFRAKEVLLMVLTRIILSAMFSGQISTAMLILRSPAVLACFPILLASGCLAGAFTGLCAKTIVGRKVCAFDNPYY